MKIDISGEIKDLDGKNLLNKEEKPLTLKEIFEQASLASIAEDNGEIKMKKYQIAKRLKENKQNDFEISNEELNLLKFAIGRVFVPLVVGRSFELIDGK